MPTSASLVREAAVKALVQIYKKDAIEPIKKALRVEKVDYLKKLMKEELKELKK